MEDESVKKRETMIRKVSHWLREETLYLKSNTLQYLRVMNAERRPLAVIIRALRENLENMILKKFHG